MFRRLFCLELKKNLQHLPYVLIAGALLSFFLTLLLLALRQHLQESAPLMEMQIAVVAEDPDDPYLTQMLGYVDAVTASSVQYTFSLSSDDFSQNRRLVFSTRHTQVTLQMMPYSEAQRLLASAEILAILYLPEHLTEDILSGRDTGIRVELDPHSSLETLMLTELTDSLLRLLRAAQAADYTLGELYPALSLESELNTSMLRLDLINGLSVAQRGYLYTPLIRTPGALVEDGSQLGYTMLYYIAVALILLISFAAMGAAPALSPESRAYYDLLYARGLPLSSIRYILCKYFAALLIYVSLLSLLWTLACPLLSRGGLLPLPSYGQGLALLLLLAAYVTALSLFLFTALPTAPAAVLCFLSGTTLMAFLSGYFLPAAFLPAAIRRIGSLLPTAPLLDHSVMLLSGWEAPLPLGLFSWIAAFLLLAMLACRLRQIGGSR